MEVAPLPKERSLPRSSITSQLKLVVNDCDRRSAYVYAKAERYRYYHYYALGVSITSIVSSVPMWYWLRSDEYAVARARSPLKCKNFYNGAVGLFIFSSLISLFSMSNFGFGFQSNMMLRFAGAYDMLGWEAKRLGYQIDQKMFDGEKFVYLRKLQFQIDDEETHAELERIKTDKDTNSEVLEKFSDLLLPDEEALDAKVAKEVSGSFAQKAKEDRKDVFLRRIQEDELTPESVAFFEMCDRKTTLDQWF